MSSIKAAIVFIISMLVAAWNFIGMTTGLWEPYDYPTTESSSITETVPESSEDSSEPSSKPESSSSTKKNDGPITLPEIKI